MKGWQKVYANNKFHLIEIVRDILKDNEIESSVIDRRDSSFGIGEIELYVKEDDMILAQFLIKEWEKEI
jgi:hypothetical protein